MIPEVLHDDADRLAKSGLAPRCVRVLVEPQEREPADALANARAIRARLAEAGIDRPLLLHGYGPAAWDVLRVAVADGLDTRIGLEDATTLPDGSAPAGNADLVAAAVALARAEEPPCAIQEDGDVVDSVQLHRSNRGVARL